MTRRIFAANWKMHLGPEDARAYFNVFQARYHRRDDREVWFFPPTVSLEAAAHATRARADLLVGAQDIYWEPKGPFTGAVSAPLAAQAGARATLVGHSERRQLFGETDADVRRKVGAALAAGLAPLVCVGETLAERDAGDTLAVVTRQLAGALGGWDSAALARIVVAYEPVWAIGTGRTATPPDAAAVHHVVRGWLRARGGAPPRG
ncbi:MAG TPA: triose-phosphate isomerase, partial [Gemmatimonadales bacterium]|nr:triose-phosphate isomerase [Gemmatimonadales bacterium]